MVALDHVPKMSGDLTLAPLHHANELHNNNLGIRMATQLVTLIMVLTVAVTSAERLVKPAADKKLHLVYMLVGYHSDQSSNER